MSILGACPSKDGATGQIAEPIAQGVRAAGQPADARAVHQAGDPAGYQGFLIGSAADSRHELTQAARFVAHDRDLSAPGFVMSACTGGLHIPDSRPATR
jgi:menaquinone-dependent protoporphyrinogen IX oxidase